MVISVLSLCCTAGDGNVDEILSSQPFHYHNGRQLQVAIGVYGRMISAAKRPVSLPSGLQALLDGLARTVPKPKNEKMASPRRRAAKHDPDLMYHNRRAAL